MTVYPYDLMSEPVRCACPEGAYNWATQSCPQQAGDTATTWNGTQTYNTRGVPQDSDNDN